MTVTLSLLKDWIWILSALGVPVFGVLMWALRKAYVRRSELDGVEKRLEGKIDGQAATTETLRVIVRQMPTKDDFHALALEMERLRGDIRAMNAGFEGLESLSKGVAHQNDLMQQVLLQQGARK